MRLAKWGNSLAVRIPSEVVDELGLSANDEAEIRVTGKHSFEVVRDQRKEEALKAIRKLARPLSAEYKFNREQAHDRELGRRFEQELKARQAAK